VEGAAADDIDMLVMLVEGAAADDIDMLVEGAAAVDVMLLVVELSLSRDRFDP
jgi:hypothetical protein